MQHITLTSQFLTKDNFNKQHKIICLTFVKDFMKLYKGYSKEPYSFLVNDATLSLDNPLQFRKNLP